MPPLNTDAPIHAAVMDEFKLQLLIALVKRQGGTVVIPVSEVDDTGNDLLAMAVDDDPITGQKQFTFTIQKKS